MDKKSYNITIIGAGISGLIAAQVLENHGFASTVYEAEDHVGGRIKTAVIDGYQLDRGFQVLLEAYPKAQEYLDFEALNLQHLIPGAIIFKNGKKQSLGDPRRDLSLLWPTLTAGIVSLGDKLKVLKLYQSLKKKSLEEIFGEEETTTLDYLERYGFSQGMINDFFRPFFSGIFLEPNLATSSRMFEFTYKLFGNAPASIPKVGICAIPQQLQSKLKKTKFVFNTKIKSVGDGELILESGERVKTHFSIIATEAADLVKNLNNQSIKWKSCGTFYFLARGRNINKPIIGLIADKTALINNIFYHTSVEMAQREQKELLSVTVVKDHNLTQKELLRRVIEDLENFCGIKNLEFLKSYKIQKALPDLKNLHYELAPSETQLTNTIFLAGDQLLNGSLNAAIIAGERAALGIIQKMDESIVL